MLFLVWTIVHQHTQVIAKDILVLGEGPTQRLDDTAMTAEANFNFIVSKNEFCLIQWK